MVVKVAVPRPFEVGAVMELVLTGSEGDGVPNELMSRVPDAIEAPELIVS